MTQNELNRQVARATGESVSTISRLGFVPLTRAAYELDREPLHDPLLVDWDQVDAERRLPLAAV